MKLPGHSWDRELTAGGLGCLGTELPVHGGLGRRVSRHEWQPGGRPGPDPTTGRALGRATEGERDGDRHGSRLPSFHRRRHRHPSVESLDGIFGSGTTLVLEFLPPLTESGSRRRLHRLIALSTFVPQTTESGWALGRRRALSAAGVLLGRGAVAPGRVSPLDPSLSDPPVSIRLLGRR